jgi:hypothetical protein
MESLLVVAHTCRVFANTAGSGSAATRCVSEDYETICAQIGWVMMCKLLTVMHSCMGSRPYPPINRNRYAENGIIRAKMRITRTSIKGLF